MENQFETMTVNLPYSPPASDKEWVYKEIEEKAQEGWLLKTRATRSGKTHLIFVKPKKAQYELEINHKRTRYTHPREKKINRIVSPIEEMARDGWRLNARTNHEGILSVGAHTRLMFVRPKGYKQKSEEGSSKKSLIQQLFYPLRVVYALIKAIYSLGYSLIRSIVIIILVLVAITGIAGGLIFLIVSFVLGT